MNKWDICEQSKRVQGPPVKADLSLRQDGATFQPFLSTRAGQQTNDREEDHDTDNREVEALQK